MIQFDVGIKMQIIINVYVLQKTYTFSSRYNYIYMHLIPPYNISTKLYGSSKNIIQSVPICE